jgi:outer membrane protein TolC
MKTTPPRNHESTKARGVFFVVSCLLFVVVAPTATAQNRQQGQPLTLSEALALAEKRSESIGIARAELARAEGDRRRARSAYFPQLNGSASYQRTLQSQFSALEGATDTGSALGRGEGADFRAPLGRAVIGGVITRRC